MKICEFEKKIQKGIWKFVGRENPAQIPITCTLNYEPSKPLVHLSRLLELGREERLAPHGAQEAAEEEVIVQPVAGRRVGLLPWRRMNKWIQLQIISKL